MAESGSYETEESTVKTMCLIVGLKVEVNCGVIILINIKNNLQCISKKKKQKKNTQNFSITLIIGPCMQNNSKTWFVCMTS